MKNLITIVSILTISISANAAVLQFKRGTESQVQASRLAAGEPAVATDSKKLFIGYSSAQGKVKQAYSPDTTLLNRTNHTGSQAMSTITGLSTALAGKLDTTGGTLTGPLVVPGLQSSAVDGQHMIRPYNSVPFSDTPLVGMIQTTDTGPEWYNGTAWQSIGGGGASSLAELSDWPAAVSATEVGHLDGVTADIQGQIDGKAATGHTHASSAVTYDNTASGMTATNVKTALDELKSAVTAQNSLITNLTTAMNNAGVDTTPPVLTRNAPVSASPAITTNSLVINYTTSDPQGMAVSTPLKYSINGAGAVAMTSGADSTLTGFTANVAIPVAVTATNDAGMTTTDTLSVTYQTPVADRSPTSKAFADTNTGSSSAAQTFTITNTGLANLTLSPGLSLTGIDAGQFALSKGTCTDGATITPSGTCTASVTFSPTTAGAKTAGLLVDSNAADVTAGLSGTGIAACTSGSVAVTTVAADYMTNEMYGNVVKGQSITPAANGSIYSVALKFVQVGSQSTNVIIRVGNSADLSTTYEVEQSFSLAGVTAGTEKEFIFTVKPTLTAGVPKYIFVKNSSSTYGDYFALGYNFNNYTGGDFYNGTSFAPTADTSHDMRMVIKTCN